MATFANKDHAREIDIVEGLALSVECDQNPDPARQQLEQLLGPATVVVRSGGIWINGGGQYDKIHLHWRLAKPASGKVELAKFKHLRDIAARSVGGDPTNKAVCHPIRWPGSLHRKAEPRLCEIITINPDRELDLDTALKAFGVSPDKNWTAPEPHIAADDDLHDERGRLDWSAAFGQIISGASYHPTLTPLAASFAAHGIPEESARKLLDALMTNSHPSDPERERRREVEGAEIKLKATVASGYVKYKVEEPPPHDGEGIPDPSGTADQAPPDWQGRPGVYTDYGADAPLPQPLGVRPVDLWGYFQPPELPHGVLPSVIEKFAFVTGEVMGADPAGLAISALVVAGAAIPDRIRLQVKQHSRGWMEQARLWGFVVGLPSTKKSPILRAAAAPLLRIDYRLYRAYLKEQEEYDKLDPKERKGQKPPRKHRLRVEDTTIEAAGEVLRDSPDGVLCLQDELSGWFGAMDKYAGPRGASKDRGFWLQSWNGGEYAVDRISRGSFLIPNLSVSVLGGVQPDAIRRIAGDTVDDGLIQRPLPVILRSGKVGHDEPTSPVVEPYDQLIERLHKLPARTLEFDSGAQQVRARLEQKHNDLLALETLNRKLAAHIGKYDGYFARLCIVWHCIEHAQSKELPIHITTGTAERVARFMHEFLLPHALAFYSGVLALADDHDRLSAVAGYILARKMERITTRDVARGDRTMRRLTRQDTNATFEQLEALGWLARKSAPRPSDPPHWLVNPLCHELFETRAREENERRARVHELIKQSVRVG